MTIEISDVDDLVTPIAGRELAQHAAASATGGVADRARVCRVEVELRRVKVLARHRDRRPAYVSAEARAHVEAESHTGGARELDIDRRLDFHLGDEVAYLIASYVKSNVRELEGSLIKIAAHAAMYNQSISMDLVRKVLKNYIAEKQKIVTIEDIIATVSQFFGMKSSDMRGPSRKGPVAKARQVVMYLARELGQLSASAVGQELGNRHHTTVLHGCSFIKESMDGDPVLKNQIRQIENTLQNKE